MPNALFLTFLTAFSAHNGVPRQEPSVPQTTLTQYIQTLHWDPAKSGPLISLETDATTSKSNSEKGLSAFQEKMVKVGGLSVICLNWAIALDESDLPNPYQALSPQEKLIFLLATLSPSDLAKLTGKGISAGDVSGEQRLALLSMIPNPLKIVEGTSIGGGISTSAPPKTFPRDQVDSIRLQMHKGVTVMYNATKAGDMGTSCSNLSSLDYLGPAGTTLYRTPRIFASSEPPDILGHVVSSSERKSDLPWADPRLEKTMELKPLIPVGELVDSIREKTGVEVYADKRVSALKLSLLGTSATIRDMLRGLMVCLGGTFRKVGPAFVLTANSEGEATREIRLQVHREMGRDSIRSEIAGWKADVAKRGLVEKLGFARDDPFRAYEIGASEFAPENSEFESNWVSMSLLPSSIQDAISHAGASQAVGIPAGNPIPDLQGKVKITSSYGFRLVLPDGHPLENHTFDPDSLHIASGEIGVPESTFPVDTKSLPDETAIGIRSDDPQSVTRLCDLIKETQVHEIWLDTESSAAIQAVVGSGLKVDLVVHPWHVFKGESCSDPDRTVLGQVGNQLNQVPGTRLVAFSHYLSTYATSYSPASPGLTSHWDRIIGLARTQGINKLVLLDTEQEGYEATSDGGGMAVGGDPSDLGLQERVPEIARFGYSFGLRLQFLRKFRMDPIDLLQNSDNRLSPLSPYFDTISNVGSTVNPYPDVEFPDLEPNLDDNVGSSWSTLRHDLAKQKIDEFVKRLSNLGHPIFTQAPRTGAFDSLGTPLKTVNMNGSEGKTLTIQFLQINSLTAQDEQGTFSWKPFVPPNVPLCFDLSEVPLDRMSVFLHYVFKLSR